MAAPATMRVKPPGQGWETLGASIERGIVPEGLTLSADEAGPSTLGFTLKRDPTVQWGDLQAANQIEVEVDGSVVWGGRINQTPGSGRALSGQIAVSAQGWRAHLDDDQVDKGWVHTRMMEWRRSRDMTGWVMGSDQGPGVSTVGGTLVVGWEKGDVIVTSRSVGVALDLGPNRRAKRVVAVFDVLGGQTDTKLFIRGNQSESHHSSPLEDVLAGEALTAYGSTGNVRSGTFTTTSPRYVHIFTWYDGPGGTFGTDNLVKFTKFLTFTATAYESGDASILKASNVISDVLSSGGLPLLSSDMSLIEATQFNIPDFWPDGYKTPAEILGAVNAFHDYRLGVDAERRLFFRSRPTEPMFEVGKWSGEAFSDASAGNLDDLHNKVIVDYTGPDGAAASSIRTLTSGLLTAQGLTRTKRLPISAALTPASADQIGDVWLRKHVVAPLSGAITVGPGDVRSVAGGAEIHPSLLLRHTGERIRLADRADQETGGAGRVGTIVNVTYDADAETATVQLDNDTGSLESFLGRLAVIQGSG